MTRRQTLSTQIREVTREELELRREAILQKVCLSRDELARRAETNTLSAEEWPAWDALSAIEFLLDDS